jgi:hypothetical protein
MSGQQLAHDPFEIIRLKDADGELVDYRDTRETRRLRRDLAEINEPLATYRIDVPGAERRGHHMVFKDEHGADYYVLPKPGNGLVRIFSRSSFEMHGRAYGWWQNIPKTARATLTINGEAVIEADYKSLHPTMLYSQEGIRFSGDAYDVDGGFERSDVKVAFNTMINAKNRNAAVWAVADAIGPDAKRRREEKAAARSMRLLLALADESANDKKQFEHYIRAAASVAKDVAPYIHPRLSTVEQPVSASPQKLIVEVIGGLPKGSTPENPGGPEYDEVPQEEPY